uniref:Uncharacterized protein n=1 Tax=Oryza meridionalis TaxID=40149 RepID=A0A0E0DAY4_9ORYZ
MPCATPALNQDGDLHRSRRTAPPIGAEPPDPVAPSQPSAGSGGHSPRHHRVSELRRSSAPFRFSWQGSRNGVAAGCSLGHGCGWSRYFAPAEPLPQGLHAPSSSRSEACGGCMDASPLACCVHASASPPAAASQICLLQLPARRHMLCLLFCCLLLGMAPESMTWIAMRSSSSWRRMVCEEVVVCEAWSTCRRSYNGELTPTGAPSPDPDALCHPSSESGRRSPPFQTHRTANRSRAAGSGCPEPTQRRIWRPQSSPPPCLGVAALIRTLPLQLAGVEERRRGWLLARPRLWLVALLCASGATAAGPPCSIQLAL